MNNNDWQKGIKDLQKITLSKEERVVLFEKILKRSAGAPVLSTWFAGQFVFVRRHVALVLILAIVLGGGGATFASERALPGSALYPLKVGVSEPIRGLVKTLPEEKIEWQAEKAVRRIEEAQILSAEDKLDTEKKAKIEVLFEKHTQSLKQEAEKKIEKQILEEDEEDAKTEDRQSEKTKKEVEKRIEELKKAKEKAFEKKSDLNKKDRKEKSDDREEGQGFDKND